MKNRHMLLKGLILLVLAVFTFSLANAQEEKEEKVIKVKVMKEENGKLALDTSFTISEDFDGDWSALIDDEELLDGMENITIDLDLDAEGNVYLIKAPHTTKKGYFYSIDGDEEGDVFVEIEAGSEGEQNVWVTKEGGDSTMTIVLKSSDCIHKEHSGEHKMIISKSADVHVEEIDGDSVITYTIKIDDGDGEHKDVMVWTSDGDAEMTHEIMMEHIEGDSCKMIIVTTGEGGEDVKIIKKKEVFILTEEVEHDDDHNKDKKKKKKDKDK